MAQWEKGLIRPKIGSNDKNVDQNDNFSQKFQFV